MLSKQLKKASVKERQNRVFSDDFKRKKVKEIESKRLKVSEICHIYEVSRSAVYKWLRKYGQNSQKNVKIVVEMESDYQRAKMLLERVAELERIIGLKQLEIDYLNKLLELESQQVGYDIKKKHEPKRWSIFANKKVNISI